MSCRKHPKYDGYDRPDEPCLDCWELCFFEHPSMIIRAGQLRNILIGIRQSINTVIDERLSGYRKFEIAELKARIVVLKDALPDEEPPRTMMEATIKDANA